MEIGATSSIANQAVRQTDAATVLDPPAQDKAAGEVEKRASDSNVAPEQRIADEDGATLAGGQRQSGIKRPVSGKRPDRPKRRYHSLTRFGRAPH